MKKHDIVAIRKDLKTLSPEAFEKKYPGTKIDKARDLSDAELEKVAGGGSGRAIIN